MMQAQAVWRVWRRIMREKPLQDILLKANGHVNAEVLEQFKFTKDEYSAAQAYAAQADRAKWFVINYRFRLVNSFINALETGAPLVLRALLNKGVNINQLGEAFLDSEAWRDFGPNVYTYCQTALKFLSQHDISMTPCGMRDLIGLEATVVELMLSLSGRSHAVKAQNHEAGSFHRTPYAMAFKSGSKISHWMRDKKLLGKSVVEEGTENYLVYLPDLDEKHKYALLPQRAMDILMAIEGPCTYDDIVLKIGAQDDSHEQSDERYIGLLKSQCAIYDRGHV